MDNISKQMRSGSRSFRRPVALAVAALAAMAAGQASAATNIDGGVGATVTTLGPANTLVVTAASTQLTGVVHVGTATTTVVPVAAPGAGAGGLLPYIVNNGDGTSTVYTITDAGATLTTTTTTTSAGGVTLDPNGNIVAESGAVTTQVTTHTNDVATATIIDNVSGLHLGADPRNLVGVLGTYNPLTGTYVADGGSTVVGAPATLSTGGGNLLVSGIGSFGGPVNMNGNQINDLADGELATDAATVGQMAVADATLQSHLTTETNARAAADLTLQSNIDNEAASRVFADHQLNKRVDTADKGVAMAMAMSAIPTVDYGKWSLGVGVGHFKSETAASVGATVKVGERTKFKVGFASGGGETGGSAGFAMGF